MTLMYDAVTWTNIPSDALIVAGYANGLYRWPIKAWDRFPNAIRVPIAVFIPDIADVIADADNLCDYAIAIGLKPGSGATVVGDIEAKDAEFAKSSGWTRGFVSRVRVRGFSPTGYTSLSTWQYLAGFFDDYWIAQYTQKEHYIANASATQYADPGSFDLSTTIDGWPRSSAKELFTVSQYDDIVRRLNAIDGMLRDGSDQGDNASTWLHQFLENEKADINRVTTGVSQLGVSLSQLSASVSGLSVGQVDSSAVVANLISTLQNNPDLAITIATQLVSRLRLSVS